MTNFNEPTNVADLIGLWDFISGNETADTGLDDGIAQNGNAVDGNGVEPSFSNDQLHVGAGSNSNPTVFDVNALNGDASDDEQFNLDRGTIEVQFTQTSQSGWSEDVVLSRGEKHIEEDDEGFFEIRVTCDGEVQSYHNTDDGDHVAELSTSHGFFSPGDVINVKYSFDTDTGARLTVENLTTGETESLVSEEKGLTFDLTDNDDEEFTFGAREKNDGEYDKEFEGSIDYVALYTTTNDPISNPNPVEPNYIVEGTSAGELIDAGYTDDPEGDMIDALDNDLTPPNNDDVVEAGAGNDTVQAGDGDDTVSGGTGDDLIFGDDDNAQAGDDLLLGEEGDDTLCGLDGDDTLDGGAGEDLLEGMEGNDLLLGGSGDDRAYGDNGDDTIFGDQGGQDEGASVREVFQWDLAPNTGAPDFSQDTGNVTVSFSEQNGGASDNISTDAQNVADIDTGTLGAVDGTSSLDSETGGQGNSDTYTLGFSDPVEEVSFRVNDIDGDGVVRIQAFDENGDPIEVILEGGSNLTLLDTDGVAGADTADSNGGYLPDTSSEYSVLVTIPGPVSEIKIFHTQDGANNSGINVTDVYFDVPNVGAPEGDGDDTLIGGAGDDLIYGNGGDDSIQGNSGDDTLFGDDPEEGTVVSGNLIFNGSFEITSGMTTTGFGFRGEEGDGVPGWTDANGNEIDFHNNGRGGIDPTDGQNWLDLESSPGNARVGQVVDGVQDGETYKLTFDAGDKSDEPQSGAGENIIEVYWGGELIATVDPEAGQMDEYTFNVIGGAGDGSNKLEFVGLGDEDNFGASIDDVSLVQLADAPGEGGDDTIKGGTGNDLIDGQGGDDSIQGGTGDDTITGGDGADSLSGGDDRDTFLGGTDGDTIDGGTGTTSGLEEDDFDVLDLTGQGPFRVINETTDADGNSTSGTIEFLDGAGDPTGETLTFTEIEEIMGDEVNEDPDAVNDSGAGDEDTSITGNVLDNDSDPDAGDVLTVVSNTEPSNGTVTIDANGDYTYTPDDNFNGEDSFTYTVSDGNGGTDTATVTLTVNPVNDAPDAVNDNATTPEDEAVTINVLGNDTDVDGDTLEITGASVPADQGTVEIVGNQLLFTPAENFNGDATISYAISDGNGGTDTATVTVDVTPVNDDPVAVDDTASTMEDESVIIDLIGNDTDVDGDTLELASVSVDPALGTVTDNGDGTVTFTPALNYNGPVTIDYTVSDGNGGTDDGQAFVSVGSVNDGPTAVDDSSTTDEDTDVTFNVIGNDTDPDNDPLEIVGATVPADQGTVTDNGDGTLTFSPAENFNGPAEITYTITDGNGGTDTGTWNVTVTPVNDDPVAVDDIETTDEDTAVIVDLLGNDTDVDDGDVLELASVSVDPSEGTVVDNGDGTVTFTPAQDFNGPATITYTVSDGNGGTDEGEAIVSVGAVNDGPVAEDDTATTDEDTPITITDVLDNDSDADGDDLTIISVTVPADQGTVTTDGTNVTFTPAEDFNGPAEITYTISDGNGGTDTGTIDVTVTPVNDGPDAVDDSGSGDEDTEITGNVLGNDTDSEMDALEVISNTDPANGTVIVDANGDYTYTPNADFNGEDSFTYTVSDGNGGTDTATVTLTVAPVADAPIAEDDDRTTDEDTAIDIDVLTNDSDPDGTSPTIASFTQPANGTVTDNGDGTLKYTPNDDYNGPDSFTYTITDGDPSTPDATATVNLTVDPASDTPVVVDDNGSGDEDNDITGNVLDNDSDADGDTLTVVSNTDPANGTVTVDPDGNYTYTPNENFEGTDSFTYTVSDGDPSTPDVTGTVNLTVNPVNDDPDAVDDSNSTDFETTVSIDLLANDTDVDNPASDLVVTSATVDPSEGTLVETAPGVYDFTPADGFEGTATVSYTISDGAGGTDSAVHTIEVGEDPTPQDGIVDGEETGEDMGLGYDDSNLPTDQGGDIITNDGDEIEGNGGDDTIDGAGGDDTISGGDDDDSITGGDGDDIVNGDDGSDTLAGGEGDDTLDGGEGDDDIAVGGNDVADGGTGDDVFTVDATDPTEPTNVVIDGGSDGTDGNPDGPENGDEGDVLDLGDQTDDLTVEFDPNPEEGTVNGLDDEEDDPADITFSEIEKVITGSGDDVVNGEDATGPIDVETGDGDDDITGGEGDDTIDAGDGDDDVEAGDGDDSITAGDGDDDVEGGDGDDTIDGGDGSDTIAGGEGDDTIDGGDGDDDIEVGAGDTADGGIGDDVFTVDDTLDGDSPITIDGGSDGTQPGDEAGPENGDDGDVLDLRGLDLVSLEFDPTDPESGTAVYNNDNGDPVTLTFTEIETVLHDPLPDGVVDGEEDGEDMGPTYDDGEQATDNGGDIIDGPDGDDDVINGNGGDDTINAGQGSDTVSGGTGDDSITGGASDDGDQIDGDEGDDTIQGEGGDDTLDGGTGDDVIEGGTGADDITGGDGADSVDGGDGNDTIDTSGSENLLDAGFPGYGPIPAVPEDGDQDNDKDTVNGGAGDDSITTGDDADVIDAGTGDDTVDAGIDDDSVEGGQGEDVIIGGEGNDTLSGGQDDDTIYGGLETPAPFGTDLADDGFGAPFGPDPVTDNNNDLIDGGAGNDLIYGQDDDDTITGGTGNDTIDGGVDDDSLLGGQGDDVIEGGHGQDFIQGNNDDDSISGGRGSDTLEGNAGDDTIIGGAGDSIIGGGGADSIFIDQDEVDENGDNDAAIFVEGNTFGDDNDTLDLTDFVAHRNLVETPDGDGDSTSGTVEVQNDELEWVEVTFNEIETLLLPPQAPDMVVDGEETGELMDPLYDDAGQATDGGGDIIDGADGPNDSIRGNGGDDTINAGEGDDTVDGGDDNDEVNGGTGDDIVGGGDGDDLVTGGFGDDTVTGGDGDDTLRGNVGDDSVVGGEGNDSMGGAEGDDTLEGGDGDDELDGGSGDDVLDGGEGNDTIEGASGNDTITDLDGDNEIISGNDGLPDLGVPFVPGTFDEDDDPNDDRDSVTTGDGDDTISTGDDADTIDAGNGDNVIDGGFDDDVITSGDGNDEILGGEGSDTINSGDGDDTIQGGIGTDAANLIDDNVNPANNDDILDNGDDLINAGAGNDVVFGEDDNDTIDGGEGNDTLDGGIDDDTVLGGAGDDLIIGGQGADSLDGGEGDDTFSVGTFTDPVFGDEYKEGLGDTIVGGEDDDDGDIDTLDLTGAGSLKVVFEDSIDPTGTPGESGTVIFYTDDTQTTVAGTLEFKEIENVIPCFTPGAMIATPRGEVPVETLREGDKVITRDNGIQEIRWTGNRTLNRAELAEGDGLKPILVKAGSLGRNLPERDMLVSPQHRVLITGETPQLYFEESEVLVAAKHLVGKQGVSVVDTMRTTYIHFMFDRHEVVLSDGAWTESFQPGDQTLGAMGEETRAEIIALFPELATEGGLTDYAAARRTLKAHEAKLIRL